MNDGAPLIPSLQVECASIDRNTPITNRHSDRLAGFTLLRVLVDLAAKWLELRQVYLKHDVAFLWHIDLGEHVLRVNDEDVVVQIFQILSPVSRIVVIGLQRVQLKGDDLSNGRDIDRIERVWKLFFLWVVLPELESVQVKVLGLLLEHHAVDIVVDCSQHVKVAA